MTFKQGIAEPIKQVQTEYHKILTNDQLKYIKQYYNGHNRKAMSRKLGVAKTIINFVILELGLDGGDWEEGA